MATTDEEFRRDAYLKTVELRDMDERDLKVLMTAGIVVSVAQNEANQAALLQLVLAAPAYTLEQLDEQLVKYQWLADAPQAG